MAKGNRGGKRATGSSIQTYTSQQQMKINNIQRVLAKSKFIINNLTFKTDSNGIVNFSYDEVRTVVHAHSGKMIDPSKNKIYQRTTTKSGLIYKDGLIKHNKDVKSEKYIGLQGKTN